MSYHESDGRVVSGGFACGYGLRAVLILVEIHPNDLWGARQNLNYRSVADLNSDIATWRPVLHAKFDLVVGIPRSGLMAATLLALHADIPVTDLHGFLERRVLGGGHRARRSKVDLNGNDRYRVLVLDDSVYTGLQLANAKERIHASATPHEIQFGAVYLLPGMESSVDFWRARVPGPRVFEWNMFAHDIVEQSCFDIDGVLCVDPTDAQNDDGEAYEAFVANAEPFVFPRRRIGWLVTSRLEKFRRLTEDWLANHGVEYGKLIMTDYPTQDARRKSKGVPAFKAHAYVETGARLFVESSLQQAIEIANLSKRPTFCMDTRQMIYPGVDPGHHVPPMYYRIRWRLRDIRRRLGKILR